jgi:hypothetical protein
LPAIKQIINFGKTLGLQDASGPDANTMVERLSSARKDVRVEAAFWITNYARGLVFRLIDELRDAHVDGFSTTRRDLINDLLPF